MQPSHFLDSNAEAPAVPADAVRVMDLYARCSESQKLMVRRLLESMTGEG